MSEGMRRDDNFDDIVFKVRNKEYGAFELRKKYSRNVLISLLIGILIMAAATITPYLNAKSSVSRRAHSESQVKIIMEDLDQPHEVVAPPPPPPLPRSSPAKVAEQVKYVPPVVADTIMAEYSEQQMPATNESEPSAGDDALEVVNENHEEIQEEETEHEPFLNVQEMPEPQGGEEGMYKFIAEHTRYPLIAYENNIQGKVFVRFCVTAKGTVEQVSILKGVDPDLDAEAMRVVKTFPPFKPGKQDGKPVPVWFIVPITFQII
jgi:protein TonB